MSRSWRLISRVRIVLFTALIVTCFSVFAPAQDLPGNKILRYEAKPVSEEQQEEIQLRLMEHRAAENERAIRIIVNAVLLMFLFAAFCTLWAQFVGRDPLLWFLLGFVFNIFAVLFIFRLNHDIVIKKIRRQKNYRPEPDEWGIPH